MTLCRMPERVEFKTLDGTLLRGDLYRAESPEAPVIVMTQGITLLKEHFVDNFARRFQAENISAFVYDHRGYGSSEGTPKYETNPIQQAEDYHDAISFAKTLSPHVAIWGIGHSGGASMIAGYDPRLSAVILVMPFISGAIDEQAFPPGIINKAWVEREAITKGQANPSTIPIWPYSPEHAIHNDPPSFITSLDAYNFITEARQRSDKAGTPSANKLTLQSFIYLSNVNPKDHIYKISPTPLLYLAAVTDPLAGPLEEHKKVFEKAGEPKEFVTLSSHHLANYFGELFEKNVAVQIQFLKKHLFP